MNPTPRPFTFITARLAAATAGLLLLLSGPALPRLSAQGRVVPDTIQQVDMVAARLRGTPQWRSYQQSCRPMLTELSRWGRDRMSSYIRAQGMASAVPKTLQLAMLVGSSGHVTKVICEPKTEFSSDVAARAATLQFPPPPSPGWPVRVGFRPGLEIRHTGRGGQDIGPGR